MTRLAKVLTAYQQKHDVESKTRVGNRHSRILSDTD